MPQVVNVTATGGSENGRSYTDNMEASNTPFFSDTEVLAEDKSRRMPSRLALPCAKFSKLLRLLKVAIVAVSIPSLACRVALFVLDCDKGNNELFEVFIVNYGNSSFVSNHRR
jgi:hypothetical protein